MPSKTRINGTNYDLNGGKSNVGGTAYKIENGKIMISGTIHEIPFASLKPVFADNSWETIIAACQSGTIPETWNVSDQKPMTINGKEYGIDIIGKYHDTYTGGGTAPLTFQLHQLYASKYSMNDSNTVEGGYGATMMHNTWLPIILEKMPVAVKNAIRSVDKATKNRKGRPEVIPCNLFLISASEVGFGGGSIPTGEGTKYPYYNDASNLQKLPSTTNWLTRSIYFSGYGKFCIISSGGNIGSTTASNARGVSFGFCF